jgi:acyl-CoA hydrolase
MPEHLTPQDAAALVRDVDSVGIPLGPGHPNAFLHAMGEREAYEELVIGGALLTDFYAVFGRPGVQFLSGFFGPLERMMAASGGAVSFVPGDFRRFAPALEAVSPRIMSTIASLPDSDGYCSLSLHAGATVGEIHRAGADPDRVLLVEVSPNFPRTLGLLPDHPHRVHLDEIDVLVESDAVPFALADAIASDVDRRIAERVSAYVTDGCTLQTGIGGIPGMVVGMLAEGDGGDYGVHSEMFTTGLMRLHEAGKVTNARKGIFPGVSITTFALGEASLYEWLDDNEDVRFLPVSVVNSPELISENAKMVSINGALAIDLAGQAVADTIDAHQFSGIGGHEDFVASSGLELEDRSLICLRSTTTVDGDLRSRIVTQHTPGAIITTPRHQMDVVITEHGVAELRGQTVRERARRLAAIADPAFRDQLLADAETWPPT